jgi:hypothetical protein
MRRQARGAAPGLRRAWSRMCWPLHRRHDRPLRAAGAQGLTGRRRGSEFSRGGAWAPAIARTPARVDPRARHAEGAVAATGEPRHEPLRRHPRPRDREPRGHGGGRALPPGLDFAAVTVEPPRDPAHGDMATNAAMVLAKPAGLKPREIAEALAARLPPTRASTAAEVAGPGFLNLRLAPARLARAWSRGGCGRGGFRPLDHGARGEGQRRIRLGQPDRADACRPCPRRGVRRRARALLAFTGHAVTREYYINDGGAQVDVLARSAYERYREANGLEPEIAEGLYPGDYLVPVGEALKDRFGDGLLDQPEERVAAAGARFRHRDDAGHDPRGSGGAGRRDGQSGSPKRPLRHRPDRGGAGALRGHGPDL